MTDTELTKPLVGGTASLLPRFRPPEHDATRPNASVEDRSGFRPCCPHAPSPAAMAPHAAQHLTDSAVGAVEAGKLGDSERTRTTASRTAAINGQIEARQFLERTRQDGDTLTTRR